jgi:hypothetical protein
MAVMLGICAICFGAYAISSSRQKNSDGSDSDEETDSTSENLWDITSSDISDISFIYDGNEEIKLIYQDGSWQYGADEHFALNQDLSAAMADAISTAQTTRTISADEADTSQFGLDSSDISISFTDAEGTSYSLVFGDYNTAADAYYAQKGDSDNVYLVSESLKSAFEYELYDLLVVDEIPETETDDLSGLEIVYGGNTYTYTCETVENTDSDSGDDDSDDENSSDADSDDGDTGDEEDSTDTSTSTVWYESVNGEKPQQCEDDEFSTYANYVLSLSSDGVANYYAGSVENLKNVYGIDGKEITVNYVDSDTNEEQSYTLHFGDETEDGEVYFTIDDSLMVLLVNAEDLGLIMNDET